MVGINQNSQINYIEDNYIHEENEDSVESNSNNEENEEGNDNSQDNVNDNR